MTEEERMLAGLPYQAWKDGLPEKRIQSKHRFAAFNACPPEDTERQKELLRELFGKIGENIEISRRFTATTVRISKSARTSSQAITLL